MCSRLLIRPEKINQLNSLCKPPLLPSPVASPWFDELLSAKGLDKQ